jgi:hypothetical protein
MRFFNPVFLLGLLGMLVPLIIHLWRRRKAKIIRFGAIRFLLLSEKATRRRRRFWEYLLLLVRMAAIGVLSLALAGPYRTESVPALSLGSEQNALVLVLDDSLSMRREKLGRPLFERARSSAQSVVGQLSDYDYAGLILPGSGEELALTKDKESLKTRIAQAAPGWQKARMLTGLVRAEQMLLKSEAQSKKIVVFTDLQQTSFLEEAAPEFFPGEIYFYDLSGENLDPNYALSPVELSRLNSAGEQALKVLTKVHNYSGSALEARLSLGLGGQVLSRGTVPVSSFAAADKSFLVSLRENFSAEGKIEIENPDALELDNTGYFHLRGGGRVKALIVDGDWSREPLSRDSYFLERALNPRLYALSRIDPEVVSESSLNQLDLSNYQVLVLANCRLLDQAQANQLKDFVAKGGGLLIALGNNTDADRYNKMLGELLPRELREVKIPFAGAEGKSELQPMRLDSSFVGDPGRHPILLPFASAKDADPALASFYKYYLFYQELMPRSRVILQLSDGAPIMVEKNFGSGAVILLASTINSDWNDLCIYPSFLPIFQQAALYLAKSLFELGAQGAMVGDQLELPLPNEKTSVLVRTSPAERGAEFRLTPEREGEKSKVTVSRLTQPGIYYFWYLPGPEPRDESNADFILAVNADPRESDFRKIELKELKKLAPAAGLYVQTEDKARTPEEKGSKTNLVKKPYHHGFLLALLILLGIEMAILTRSGWE